MVKKATTPQIRKIYALSKELNMDSETLHIISEKVVGVGSISKLTNIDAIKLIDELEFAKTGERKKKIYRANRATEDQIYKIQALEKELGWNNNPKRLKGFMKRYGRVEDIKWLTFETASNLIEALKKVLEHEQEKKLSDNMSMDEGDLSWNK